MSFFILEKTENQCRHIILNNPKSLNAINFELAAALKEATHQAALDSNVRVVLIRGAEGNFCAGGDLNLSHQDLSNADLIFQKISSTLNEVILNITRMPKPVIAAIEGPAYAAGFGLALSCDLLLLHENAKLSPSFVLRGLSPNASSSYFLPRIIGLKRATAALMTGQIFSAKQAFDLGIAHDVFTDDQFEKKLQIQIEKFQKMPTLTLGRIKKLMQCSQENPFQDQLELEMNQIAASSLSDDFKEGVQAFFKKEKPQFKGK